MEKPLGYIVIKRERCGQCENGMIQHPDWAEYWKQFPPGPGDEEKEARFWASMGYGYKDIIPPEEVKCDHCDGVGYLEAEVGLLDALYALHVELSFE